MRHDECHRHVGERHAGFCGKRQQLLDRVEAAFVRHLLRHHPDAERIGRRLALAVASRQQALRQRAPYQHAHAVALRGGQHVALDAAVEDGVGRLLAAEAGQPALFRHPLGFEISEAGKVDEPIALTFPARIRSVSTPSVSSMSVSGAGR